MDNWRTTAFVGDEADRYVDRVAGLDNWQEIAGRKIALGQDPFDTDALVPIAAAAGNDPFPMIPVEPGMLSVGAERGRDPFANTPTKGGALVSVGADDPFVMLPAARSTIDVGHGPFLMTPAPSNANISVGEAVRAVAAEAQRSRSPVPELTVVPFSEVDAYDDDLVDVIVGASVPSLSMDPMQPAAMTSPFPLTEALYRQSAASTPNDKVVRLDDDESYADFRARGFQKALAADSPEQIVERGGAKKPYRSILLSLPPGTEDCVECWQEDDMICCSMRLPGSDGKVKIATAATPVDAHVQEVTGYVQRSGLAMVDVLGVIPHLVGMLGAGSLVPKLASAAPSLLARPEANRGTVFIGKMKGGEIPSAAALLALLQMAQSGDPQALHEWGLLVSVARGGRAPGLADFMKRVQVKLAEAQRS